MHNKVAADDFAQARQEKRLLFQKEWNHFITSPIFLSALIFFTVGILLFTVFSGSFLHEQAIALHLLQQEHPIWWDFVVFALQLLFSLPGWLFAVGLWKIRKKTRWQEDLDPDVSGLLLMRRVNFILWVITGGILFLYPTIMIAASEYMKEKEIIHLFYLLVSSVALFIICVTLVRIVLRNAEENLICCWANSRFVLLLAAILLLIVPAVFLFAPLSQPFYIALAVLAAGISLLLFLYWLFLRKTASAMEQIDQAVIASRENSNDPYTRY